MTNKRICIICGREFEVRAGYNAKYCSQHCRNVKNYKSREKTCPTCGKAFKGSNERRYCSKECSFNRPVSHTMAYLCQKYRMEGHDVKWMADLLRLSQKKVKEALRVKLSHEDYKTMKERLVK